MVLPLLVKIKFMKNTIKPSEAKQYDKYDSGALRNTHQFITIQALNMLKLDFEKLCKNNLKFKECLSMLEKHVETLKKGCIDPDYGVVGIDRDYKLYQDHFYDPDTNQNFTATAGWYWAYKIDDTAESQCRAYFSRAIALYLDGNHEKAIRYLGRALHYFEDSNEPHHTLNWTGGAGTAHTRFENYAEEKKSIYAVEKMRNFEDYNQFKECKFIDFIHKMEYKHAKMAKAMEPFVSLNNTWKDWDHALEIAIKNAQEGAAILMYRFIQEVSEPKKIKIDNPIGKFHVVITTGNHKDAQTDDTVYFVIEDKDGVKTEFTCDLAGNDFEQGCTGIYQFDTNKILPQNITKIGLRKDKTGLIDNQMQLSTFEVYIQGKRVAFAEPNCWLSYNTPFIINCKGV